MNKKITITLIVVLSVLSLALIGFMIAVMTCGFNLGNFSLCGRTSTNLVVDKTYDSFDDIAIKANMADIYIYSSDNSKTQVKIYDDENKTIVNALNNKLNIKNDSDGFLAFLRKKAKIEVYLSKAYSNKISISDDLGNICVEKFPNAEIEIKEDCGNVEVAECKTADVNNDLGNIFVAKAKDIKATESSGNVSIGSVENAYIHNDLGNIEVDTVNAYMDISNDCGNIEVRNANITKSSTIKNDLGRITVGSTSKVFIDARCDMGKVDVRNNYNQSDITLKLENSMGDITVNN